MTKSPLFPVRDADFRVVARLPLAQATQRKGLERVDIWPAGKKGVQLGLAWSDGSTAIVDAPWSPEKILSWLRLRQLDHLARQH